MSNQNSNYSIPLTDAEKKKRKITAIIILALVLVAVLFFLFTGMAGKAVKQIVGPAEDQSNTPAHAAEIGVAIYNTITYGSDYNVWMESVCAISTEETCADIKSTYGPMVTQALDQTKVSDLATDVKALKMVDESKSTTKPQQIWAVQYMLTTSTGTKTKISYILVTQVNGIWKFDFYVLLPQGTLDKLYGPKLTPTVDPTK
jgi:hypothetical protein